MSTPKVLLVGLKTSAVDFGKWPTLSVEKLENAFKEIQEKIEKAGYTLHWCLTESDERAIEQLKNDLKTLKPDLVLIGAGVRKDPDLLLLFEQMINLVTSESPKSKIAFNSLPFDSVDAIQRWI